MRPERAHVRLRWVGCTGMVCGASGWDWVEGQVAVPQVALPNLACLGGRQRPPSHAPAFVCAHTCRATHHLGTCQTDNSDQLPR